MCQFCDIRLKRLRGITFFVTFFLSDCGCLELLVVTDGGNRSTRRKLPPDITSLGTFSHVRDFTNLDSDERQPAFIANALDHTAIRTDNISYALLESAIRPVIRLVRSG